MNENTSTTRATATTAGTPGTCLVTTTVAGILSTAGAFALLVGLSAGPATAIPVPDHGAGPVLTTVQGTEGTAQHPRPCFLVRPRWNAALDGPLPTC
jgi:hypothetical protein